MRFNLHLLSRTLQILIWQRAHRQTVILIARNRRHFKMNTRVIGVNPGSLLR